MAFLQQKNNNKYYTHPLATEIYQLIVFVIPLVIFFIPTVFLKESLPILILLVLLGIESIQYQLRSVLLRPFLQPNFKLYSALRSLIIVFIQYIQIIFIYANIYLLWFYDDFNIEALDQYTSLEFSIITITTVGFGSIYPNPGSLAGLFAATEGLVGVFILGVIISTTMSRTRPVKEVGKKVENNCAVNVDLKNSIEKSYWKELLFLSSILENDLWLIGGWVRNLHFGNNNYIGDIDCLSSHSTTKIESTLKKHGVRFDVSKRNGIIIPLKCGNHIDLCSTDSFTKGLNKKGITEAINNFNFSVNAVAMNVYTNEVISTKQFLDDILNNTFKCTALDTLVALNYYNIKLLKDYLVLKHYYELDPIMDSNNASLSLLHEKLTNKYKVTSFKSLRQRIDDELIGLTDLYKVWVVRGALRSTLLDQIQFWDDLDVVIEASKKELFTYLAANEIPYTLNYFGNPKIIFDNGDVMDIWSLPTGKTLLEHLEEFSFLNDSMALNISSGTLIELKNSTRYTKKKILQVNKKWLCSATESDRAYASLKSLYLLLRHDMKPSSSIANLISANYLITSLLKKNSIKLAKELFIISETSNLNCKMNRLATDFVLGNSANLLAELITNKAFKRN